MAQIIGPDHLTGTQPHGRLRGGHCADELLGYSLADGPRDDDRSRGDMGWALRLFSIELWLLSYLLRALWDFVIYGRHTATQWPRRSLASRGEPGASGVEFDHRVERS